MADPTPTDTHRVRRVYALAPVFFPHDSPWNDYAAQQFDNWLATHDAETLESEADRIRVIAKESAEAQRASDLEEGLPLIGTSTANEVEWYQMGNWAEGLLRTHAAERRRTSSDRGTS